MSLDRQCVQRDLSVSATPICNFTNYILCENLYYTCACLTVVSQADILGGGTSLTASYLVLQTAPWPTCLPLWLR